MMTTALGRPEVNIDMRQGEVGLHITLILGELEFYPLLRANSRLKWMLDVSHLRNEVGGLY